MYREEDYLLLSGIQHFAFCRRQWALIHIEQQWQENLRTIEGNILHKKAHDIDSSEKRGDLLTIRGMPVASAELGLNGVCDVVEFKKNPDGVEIFGSEGKYKVTPVEYKKGKPKEEDFDALQLTAQAMCLEEMLLCEIAKAYLYYGETRHRTEILLTSDLRDTVIKCCSEMHQLYDKKYTPKVKISKRCNACSLKDLCIPKLCKNRSVKKYLTDHLKEESQ